MRRVPLKLVPPPDHSHEPGYRAWKAAVFGHCAVCGEGVQRLERHHVIAAELVRREHGQVWDLRNSLLVGVHCSERCHSRHTTAARRLPASAIPAAAIEFAVELLGAERADAYIDRFYAPR